MTFSYTRHVGEDRSDLRDEENSCKGRRTLVKSRGFYRFWVETPRSSTRGSIRAVGSRHHLSSPHGSAQYTDRDLVSSSGMSVS